MRNTINYFYNLNPETINNYNNYYYFYYNNNLYTLFPYNRDPKDIESIYNLNTKMITAGLKPHQIILNKHAQALSLINNNYYILYKIQISNLNKKTTLLDIDKISRSNIQEHPEILQHDWSDLWAKKIDYLEYQINQTGKKYPLIVESFSYFVGLTENAISYVKNTFQETKPEFNDIGVISHRKIAINDNLFSLYMPTNIIIDYKIRDIAEYIKNAFFEDNFNIREQLNYYFSKNYFSVFAIRLLFARVLYPSFYFNMYDDIITGRKEEKEMVKITSSINEYEDYIYEIFIYLKKFYPLPEVEWINRVEKINKF